MKRRPFFLALFFFLPFLAFVTNPGREKHAEKATEILVNHYYRESGESLGIMGGLVGTFIKETVSGNLHIKNYYFFSKSYIYSERRDLQLDLGFGIFGQVLPMASEKDLIAYDKAPKSEKGELTRDKTVPQAKQDKATRNAIKAILDEPEGAQ